MKHAVTGRTGSWCGRSRTGRPISIPDAGTLRPYSLHAGDPTSQFRRQQPIVGGFNREFPDGGDPHVDGYRAESAGLQSNAPPRWSGLLAESIEGAEAWFQRKQL